MDNRVKNPPVVFYLMGAFVSGLLAGAVGLLCALVYMGVLK